VKDTYFAFRPQPGQAAFQYESLLERLVHQPLDEILAERRQGMGVKTTYEADSPSESNSAYFMWLSVEHDEACLAQDGRHLIRLSALEVVIAENGENRQGDPAECLRQNRSFVGQTPIGEITAEDENVRVLSDRGEKIPVVPGRMLAYVNIANCRYPHLLLVSHVSPYVGR
jgi:hypothetical protein